MNKFFVFSEFEFIELFLNEILSLTFDKKKSPYLMLGNKKVYLKLESHDDGILKKNETKR